MKFWASNYANVAENSKNWRLKLLLCNSLFHNAEMRPEDADGIVYIVAPDQIGPSRYCLYTPICRKLRVSVVYCQLSD